MSILWEKSAGWRWLVRRTRDSKPFFFTFAALCGVVPGVIGYGVMQLTSSRNEQLEAHLRSTARPDTTVRALASLSQIPLRRSINFVVVRVLVIAIREQNLGLGGILVESFTHSVRSSVQFQESRDSIIGGLINLI